MTRFVDRVERKAIAKTEAQHKAEEEKLTAIRASIPASAFETSILDAGLPDHVAYILQEAGYFSAETWCCNLSRTPMSLRDCRALVSAPWKTSAVS
jgi:hypothetical protein